MMRFQYQPSFFAIEYEREGRGVWILKESQPPHTPDENSLIESPEYQQHMSKMGEEGWEMVSVQPLLQGTKTLLELLDLAIH